MMCIIWFLLDKIIRKPLKALITAADQLAQNNFDAKLPPYKSDEIGLLVKKFGSMRESINKLKTC